MYYTDLIRIVLTDLFLRRLVKEKYLETRFYLLDVWISVDCNL